MDNNSPFRIEPTEKQAAFITHTQRYGCMSGGYGSGKTFAGCMRSLILSQYPKNVGLVGRLTYRELADTTRKTFFEICPPEYYDDKRGGRWSPTENNLKLVNGSEILFRHLDTVSEAELKSLNIGWFFIDQAEEVSLPVVRVLMSRLRLNTVPNRYGFFSCNPEPGSWIDDMFKAPYDKGELDKRDFFYLDSTTYDNPYNPPEYVEDLKRRYPPEMVKRYVEGSWEVLENIIYSEFDSKVHVVNPFQIPKEWEHIVSVDHGMVNPTGVIFAAIDYDYNVYCVAPQTKLLTDDLVWTKAGDIKVGDALAGFNENIPTTKKRRWEKSIVESIRKIKKPSYRLTLSDGTSVVCSEDHQWLTETLGTRRQWRTTKELKLGWKLLKVSEVWDFDETYGGGYLAAALDGEGSLVRNQRGTITLSFVQNENFMLAKVKQELDKRGIRYGIYKRKGCDALCITITRKKDVMKILGSVRPERLLPKFNTGLLGGFSSFAQPEIIKKEFLGMTEVMAIQTSTKTFIAEGLASHNCYDEHYAPGIVSEHAKAIKQKVGDQEISLWLIDPSTNAKTREKEGKPFSIIEEYEDNGLYFIPANNQKLAGINRVKEFLKINPDRRNPITREKGSPRLFIFKNCVNTIWEMKQYKWRKLRSLQTRNAPEEPIDYADHLMDALYYLILSRFPPPSRTIDGKALILPADRVNSNLMSVDNSQTNVPDEVLGNFSDDSNSVDN